MGKETKSEAECLFCMRKLKTNIYSLNSASCQKSFIKEKLMSFISPRDYERVNDSALFPNPKICKPCFNLVNTIHRNAVKIQSLTGTHLNFHLDCESAVDGNPIEKWPDIKLNYEPNIKSDKVTSSPPMKEPHTKTMKKKGVTRSQTKTKMKNGNSKYCLSLDTKTRDFNEPIEMQDSGDETDNYYEVDECIMNDMVKTEREDLGPSASPQQTWSVKQRSTGHSAHVPILSLKRVKSNQNSMTVGAVAVKTLKTNREKTEKLHREKNYLKMESPTQKHLNDDVTNFPETASSTNFFEENTSKSNGKKKRYELSGMKSSSQIEVPEAHDGHPTQHPDKSIPCEVCGKMFQSRGGVQRHVNIVHNGDKPKKAPNETYVCEINGCNKAFRWRSCMVRHKALIHCTETYKHKGKVVKYTCEFKECKKEFNRRRLLREHMNSVHGRAIEHGVPKLYKEWLCPDCGMAVIKIQMNRHRDTYHSPGSIFNAQELGDFVCKTELCGEKFEKLEDLKAHIPSHAANPPYRCLKDNCPKTFLLKKNFDVHMMIHDNVKPFVCKVDGCGKGFATQLCLMRHSRRHTDKNYICPVEGCGAVFSTMNTAGGHLANHRGEKPYVCGLCGAVLSSYNMWAKHKKRHSRNSAMKAIKCSKCDQKFEQAEDLERHIPIHSGEKPYTCEVCGMAYNSKPGYRSHMLKHGDQRYECKVDGCGKKFTLPLTLKRHQAVHENSTKLCSSCGKIVKVSLRKHKCAIIKEGTVDGKPTNPDLHTQDPFDRAGLTQPRLPLHTQPSVMPASEYQEYDQLFQSHQDQHKHDVRPVYVQEGKEATPKPLSHQQQSFRLLQNHNPQHQPHQPERQHMSLQPFQPGAHSLIQPVVMTQESRVSALVTLNSISSSCNTFGFSGTDDDIKQSRSITIPAPNVPMSNFAIGSNFQSNISYPSLPASMSSLSMDHFPMFSVPALSEALTSSTVPLMSVISQPTSLTSMPLVHNAIPIDSSVSVTSNSLSGTDFATCIPLQSPLHNH